MKQFLDIFFGLTESILNEPVYITKMEVIREIMGVPAVAIQSLANSAGVEPDEKGRLRLNESNLSYFADAYVRKMKSYFHRAKREMNQLGPDEILTFNQFCTTFKNPDSLSTRNLSWEDIDVNAIRKQFIKQVKAKSSQRKSVLDLFSGEVSFYVEKSTVKNLNVQLVREQTEPSVESEQVRVLKKVTLSRLYSRSYKKIRARKRAIVRPTKVFVAAHYRIYSASDDEEIPMDYNLVHRNAA